jgi:hypothetical protein
MYAAWGKARSAEAVARLGVDAGCEFDKSSAAPARIFTIALATGERS